MARMIPSLTPEQLDSFKSRAEARFYSACESQLPADCVVIHSAGWIYRDVQGRLREGEADFVILSPKSGVFAVEVKGGGVVFESGSGEWFSVDRHKIRNRIKDPFRQASNERHALLDQLHGHPAWRQWGGTRLTLGHAVVLPDVIDSKSFQGPDRPREIIGASNDIKDLTPWFERLAKFWRQPNDDALGSQGVKLVEEVLCRSIEVFPVLRSVVDDVEQVRLRLTSNQAKVLRTIRGRKRAVVSGGAGTGKTLIAVEKARQLAREGQSVLFLCYNRPLADSLAAGLRDVESVTCLSFHQLCDRRIRSVLQSTGRNLMQEAMAAYGGHGNAQLYEVQMPYALALSNELTNERFDSIVVDEAQDFSDEYWFAVEELLADPDSGSLYIFIDENQKLYPRHSSLPVQDEPYYLISNCRNTCQIHGLAYAYYSGEHIDPPSLDGPPVKFLSAESNDAQADALIEQVKRWVQVEGLLPHEVVVLVTKRPKLFHYELLQARGHDLGIRWVVEDHDAGRGVLLDTVARFKGLEAPAVVLWLADEVIESQQWETVYVGATRAKSLLTVVGSRRAVDALKRR